MSGVDVGIVVVLRLFSLASRLQLPILLLRLHQILILTFLLNCTNFLGGRAKIDFRCFCGRNCFIESED